MPAFTCHRCLAREMSRSEYVAHLAIVHDIILRLTRGMTRALAVLA